MQKNTPELWDSLWTETAEQEDRYNLKKEENSIRWQRIEKEIILKFGDFKNLKVIEVGAGSGTNSLLFARRGAKVSVLDYSKNAISRSREFFKRNKCKADFVLADALKLPAKLKREYDVAMSFGLAEHFEGRQRTEIINSHFDLIKKNGIALISVPNKGNIPYRIHKAIMNILKFWKFGEEYPFTRQEFYSIGRALNVKKIKFIGDSFLASFRFINPFLILYRKLKIKRKIKKEKGSFLDSYLGYAIVFIGEKG